VGQFSENIAKGDKKMEVKSGASEILAPLNINTNAPQIFEKENDFGIGGDKEENSREKVALYPQGSQSGEGKILAGIAEKSEVEWGEFEGEIGKRADKISLNNTESMFVFEEVSGGKKSENLTKDIATKVGRLLNLEKLLKISICAAKTWKNCSKFPQVSDQTTHKNAQKDFKGLARGSNAGEMRNAVSKCMIFSAIALYKIGIDAQNGFLLEIASFRCPCVGSSEFLVLGIRVATRLHIETELRRISSSITISPSAYARPAFFSVRLSRLHHPPSVRPLNSTS
jgi:hypothetical protein